jgi:hypothetical protein
MGMSKTPISIPELVKLEEAGIETFFMNESTYLNVPWESWLNRIDAIMQETNLKVMIDFFYAPLHDWWLIPLERSESSYREYRHVDYENPEVGPSMDRCMLDILDRVDETRVQLVYGGVLGGEFLWQDNSLPCPLPIEALIEFYVDRQKICANLHGEVWTLFHHNLGGALTTTTAINNALYDAFPIDEYDHYRIQFVQFSPPLGAELEGFNKMALRSNPKSKYFVGSEWVEGLITNYEKAMEHGTYGFLTAPLHPMNNRTRMEDWMFDNIKETLEKLNLDL